MYFFRSFVGLLLRSDFIHVKNEFHVNILKEIDQILCVASGGGTGHIHSAFFMADRQTDGDLISMPFQEFVWPRQALGDATLLKKDPQQHVGWR
jgi:hypothetical protein